MGERIVIRGTGLVTALGTGVDATWRNLLAGESISTHTRCDVPGAIGRVQMLARMAATEALAAAPISLSDSRTALLFATSRGSADDWIEACNTLHRPAGASDNKAGRLDLTERRKPGEYAEPSFGLSISAQDLAAFLGHGDGLRLTFSAACASGLHAIIRAILLIEQDDADRALVVSSESSLHPLFLHSFRRLGVLADDGDRCRPFDIHRSGFLASEASAAVVILRTDSPSPGDVLIDRYAFAGDAGHLTAFDPNAGTLQRLLFQVIDGRPVDVIHAHGTGTIANDAAEAVAIQNVLQSVRHEVNPHIYSHKGALGHSLGSAGLVAAVLNVQMHKHHVIPGNAGLREAIALPAGDLFKKAMRRSIGRSAVCAAGFGGATAAITLESPGSEKPASGQ